MSVSAPAAEVDGDTAVPASRPAADRSARGRRRRRRATGSDRDGAGGDARPARRDTRGFIRRNRLLFAALVLCVMYHGALLLSGSYQRTYDAYVHIFFADHYRRWWFSNWDDRWYTGFSVFSYPPGSHQSIALLSMVFGLRTGFVIVQLSALLNLTVGVYRWSKLWVDRTSAGWAAILLVISSSIAETVHVFGQLPTTFSLGFLLNALPFADRWVRRGDRRALLAGVACTMACTAGHHVTTLFGSLFFLGPVLVAALVAALRTPCPDEPAGHPDVLRRSQLMPLVARRVRRVLPATMRAGVYGVLVVVALLFVVLPYWLFSRSDPITQVSIPHASRDNFLVNLNAGLVFWLIPWGTTLLVLPYAFLRGFSSKAWPLTLSLAVLAFLGTGGTTPFPKLLLGGAYYILTLDRFTFWATISVLPLAGRFVASTIGGSIRRALVAQVGRVMAGVLPMILLVLHLGVTLFAANLTHYRPFQPQAIDPTPITTFMGKDNHSNWRYLTLGFGDQMAWLGANMTAETVDGDYHSARQLPELTSRPVERLEGSKYSGVPGIGSLQQFLAVPSRYSLKYVFSNDQFYSPLLDASGWTDLGPLENGIEVWERADVPPLAVDTNTHLAPAWERYMWGIVPMSSIFFALVVLAWMAVGAPGRIQVPRRLRPVVALAGRPLRPFRRLSARVDRALATRAARLPPPGPQHAAPRAPAADRWLPWRSLRGRFHRRVRRPVSARRRRLQAAAVAALLLVGTAAAGARILRPAAPSALQVVEKYYDDLDFRRFADAYALLDPQTRPAFVQYQTDLGRDGGLVASFAKLASTVATVTEATPGRVVVSTTLTYLTSLQSYEVTDDLVLRQVAGAWYLDLPPADATQPPEEFTSRPEISFLSQGRRTTAAAGDDSTAAIDVLDRPELTLSQVKSLKVNDRWVVIGRVTNADVNPADVTVQAQLRDPGGTLLSEWDAAQVLVHKLLPGESSSFRIEFQSLAGNGDYGTEADGGVKDAGGDTSTPGGGSAVIAPVPAKSSNVHGPVEFDPQTITPLVLPAGAVVADVGVYARAVVTPVGSVRGLQVLGLHLEHDASGYAVAGELRNDTTVEAAVPHLLLSYTDASGHLAWVDHAYLQHSIGPQSLTPFRVAVADSAGIAASGVPTDSYAGPSHEPPVSALANQIALPAVTGFAGVSVAATTYARSG